MAYYNMSWYNMLQEFHTRGKGKGKDVTRAGAHL
jgi:hypothetical protein